MSDKPMPVELVNWRPLIRNTLRGFATVKIGAMKIADVAVHRKNDRTWAQLPAKPQMNQDGTARRNADGKIQYTPVVEWATREAADRFSDGVAAAVLREQPDALA